MKGGQKSEMAQALRECAEQVEGLQFFPFEAKLRKAGKSYRITVDPYLVRNIPLEIGEDCMCAIIKLERP